MTRQAPDDSGDLVAAYREGLGLAAVVVIGGPANLRIKVAASDEDGDGARARWWCRGAAEAGCVAAAAARQLRHESKKQPVGAAAAIAVAAGQPDESEAISLGTAAVLAAADKLGVLLQSDHEIAEQAGAVIARIEAELQQQRACGGLKAVNQAYRAYRLDSSARGARVERYDEWMRKYRQNLVRQVAAALRQV